MSRIFLTGCNGFIGKHLYPKLIKFGHDVETDIRYLHSRSYDVVIHLAAITHINCEFDHKLIESNVLLTNEIFKTPARVVYASSCSAAHLTNPYAYTKQWAEYCGMRHGNALGLRFHNVYGTGNNKGIVWFLMNQPNGADVTIRGANLVRDYIHVDDVVNEIIRQMKPMRISPPKCIGVRGCHNYPGLEKNIGVVDVGTGTGTTTLELVRLFEEVSGKSFNIFESPAGSNEPFRMVSDNIVKHCSLKDGLVKTVNA